MARNFQQEFEDYLAAESERRDDAFLLEHAPVRLLGETAPPITLHRWNLLNLIQSPLQLATRSEGSAAEAEEMERAAGAWFVLHPEELVRALWVLTEGGEHKPDPQARPIGYRQEAFIRRITNQLTPETIMEDAALIWRHVAAAFADAPPPVSRSTGRNASDSLASASAEIIHSLAGHYHWAPDLIRYQMPLPQIWQYLRLIAYEAAPDRHIIQRRDLVRGQLQQEYKSEIAAWNERQAKPSMIAPELESGGVLWN